MIGIAYPSGIAYLVVNVLVLMLVLLLFTLSTHSASY